MEKFLLIIVLLAAVFTAGLYFDNWKEAPIIKTISKKFIKKSDYIRVPKSV